jgi:LL-diaminopimelate aminotransferase
LPLKELDLLFIENVGNMVCPTDFELGTDARIVVVSVTEGDDVVNKHPMIFRVSDIGIINKIDLAYSEIAFDGYQPFSFLEMEGAKEVGVEFHSLSKTFNMTGWRIGFAVGHSEIVSGLGRIKTNIDSGLFQAIQEAGTEALNHLDTPLPEIINIYERRRDVMVKGLREIGLEVDRPKATFYLWIQVPRGYTSAQFATLLIEKGGIVVTPGNGFGEEGEGYIRMALTVDEKRLKEAIERLKRIKF